MTNQPIELEINSIKSSYRPPLSWHAKRILNDVSCEIGEYIKDIGTWIQKCIDKEDVFYFLAYEEELKGLEERQRAIRNGEFDYDKLWPTYIDFLDGYIESVVNYGREAKVPDENIFRDISVLIAENHYELLEEHLHPRRPNVRQEKDS